MAVLRLSDGSVWVHSPVELDDTLAAALDELGPVKHIVSPNYEHTKYARQASCLQLLAQEASQAQVVPLMHAVYAAVDREVPRCAVVCMPRAAAALRRPLHNRSRCMPSWHTRSLAGACIVCPLLYGRCMRGKSLHAAEAEAGTPGGQSEWLGGEVQCTWLGFEHNPFNGKPFFNEARS